MSDYPPKNPQENIARKRTSRQGRIGDDLVEVAWDEAVAGFVAYLEEREKSPKTLIVYQSELRQFKAWHVEKNATDPELRSLEASDLRDWKADLNAAEKAKTTINKKLAAIASFLRWAEEESFCHTIRRPVSERPPKPTGRWLSRPVERKLLKEVRKLGKKRDIALVQLMFSCGLRISEMEALTWEDIKIAPRSGMSSSTARDGRNAEAFLDADAREALKAMPGERTGPVFVGQRGPLTANAMWRIITDYAEHAGFKEITPHQLRHTCFKGMANRAEPIHVIGAAAGHENLNTTRIYIEPGREEIQRAYEGRSGSEG